MSQVISDEKTETIVLEPVQTLRTIDATKDAISSALAASRRIVVDGSLVEDADITIVQLLTAARSSAERLGAVLAFQAPSAALRTVLERAGVSVTIGDDPFWNGDAA